MAQIQAITVPKWGLTMTEGTVTEWLVNEGDTINVGDPIMDMETSKIANVVESIVAGTLRRKVAQPGDVLPVAALMGVVAEADVSDALIDDFIANYVIDESVSGAPTGADTGGTATAAAPEPAPTPAPAEPKTAAPAATPAAVAAPAGTPSVPDALKGGNDDSGVHASVHARRLAGELGINLNNVTGTGRNGRISVADIEQTIVDAGGSVPKKAPAQRGPEISPVPADDSGVPATSVARRLAKTLGINLHTCRPTGRHGKVCKYDVEAAHALQVGAPAPAAPTPEIAAETAPAVAAVPMSGMRRTIASRLQASKQTIPHYRVSMDIRLDALLALRKQINDGEPAVNVSVNDCVVKAVAMALVKMPEVNVQYDEASQSIQRFRDADISVAVAIPDGLITPIVRAANTKTLTRISTEMRELATRAKAGTLRAEEFQGGSFSISNLGMFGVRQFDAIINPPQAAILAVAGGEQRMVVENGEPQVATVMTVSLSSDHRVVDGAAAAQFLQVVKRFMETPSMMLA
jgi:pyruvate dehydrogenase E2 component (dihydrolipoamide acetyltransferase)